jgi:hypothetical protein
MIVAYAVEGSTDVPVARKILLAAGAQPGQLLTAGGKTKLDPKIPGIARAAARSQAPWLVLRDLDDDDRGTCVPALRARLVGDAEPPTVVLRFAVRSVEAWLMADRNAFARFFKVRPGHIPQEPDKLANPKRALVDLCRASRSPEVRRALVPREGAGRMVGAEYVDWVTRFAAEEWEALAAAQRSPSLARAITRVRELADRVPP